jgi:ubiquinone biosynthesis monooxygenase Coq6
VKSYAKIPTFGWAYDAQAVVATLEHAPIPSFLGDNTTAFQRFLPTGPIAFLPLTPTVSSLVWSTKPALAKSLTQVEPQVLARLINAAFRLPHISINYLHDVLLQTAKDGSDLSEAGVVEEIKFREAAHGINEQSPLFSSLSPSSTQVVPPSGSHLYPPLVSSIQPRTVASFPLRFGHAETYLGEGVYSRTVLVGDAAHTVHPLAGQGLNMGLGDVGSLADCIEKAAMYGGDIGKSILYLPQPMSSTATGSRTTLIPYARSRYLENHTIMSTIDKLHKLYSYTASPVVWARSVGLEIVNEMDTLKAAFMMSAGATTRTSSFGQLAGEGYGTAMKIFDTAQTIARTVGGAAASTVVNILKNNENRR